MSAKFSIFVRSACGFIADNGVLLHTDGMPFFLFLFFSAKLSSLSRLHSSFSCFPGSMPTIQPCFFAFAAVVAL
ncbi:MAG: hypothetical protein LBH82_01180 [Bacteroidales bacterium]|jgi:hypothetical protein|nr:hypothetical protein [Bacteroidales bacterium]